MADDGGNSAVGLTHQAARDGEAQHDSGGGSRSPMLAFVRAMTETDIWSTHEDRQIIELVFQSSGYLQRVS
jgi:hypothetical protein